MQLGGRKKSNHSQTTTVRQQQSFFLSLQPAEEKKKKSKTLFESTPTEQRLHTLKCEGTDAKKKSDKLIHRHG